MLAHVQGKVSPRRLRLFACGCCRLIWPLLADPRSRAAVEIAERFADGLATEDEMNRAFETALHAEPTATRDDAVITTLLAIPHLRWLDGEFLGRLHRLGVPPAAQAGLLRCVVGSPSRPVTPLWEEVNEPVPVKAAKKNPFAEAAAKAGALFRKVKRPAVPWLTPAVLALAGAAYAETQVCGTCGGSGFAEDAPLSCNACHGAGSDGLLGNDNLARLSDALEEAGCAQDQKCPACKGDGQWRFTGAHDCLDGDCPGCAGTGRVPNALLTHLRDPGPHVRGCHVVDLLLGKE
jgi:hypothetical protein